MSQYTNLFLRAFKRTSGSNASLPSEIRDLKKALAEYYNAGYAPGDPKRMVLQDNLDDWAILDNFLEVIHKQGFIDQHFIKEIAEIFEGIRADRTVDQIKLDEEYDLGGYSTGVNLAEDIPNEIFRNNLIEAFGKGEVEAAVRIKKDSGIKDRDPSKWGIKTSENWEDELVWLLEGRNHPEHPLRYEREDGASSKYMGIKGNTPLGGGPKGEVANLGVQNEGEAMARVQQMIDEISNNEWLLRPFRDALASGEKFGIFNDIQRQQAVASADEALAKLGTADTSVGGSLDNISKDISTLIESKKKRNQILKDAVDEIDPSQETDNILTDNWVDKRISEIDRETKIAQATSQEIEEAQQAMAIAIEQGRIEEAKTIADELKRMGVKLDEGGYKSDVPTDMSNILKKPEHAKGGRIGFEPGGLTGGYNVGGNQDFYAGSANIGGTLGPLDLNVDLSKIKGSDIEKEATLRFNKEMAMIDGLVVDGIISKREGEDAIWKAQLLFGQELYSQPDGDNNLRLDASIGTDQSGETTGKAGFTYSFDKGGRVGLEGGGGPLDKMKMNRRGFLGLLGSGLAALTAGGKGLFTAAPKVAEVAATNAIPLVEGMPSWFPLLVNKIRDKGKITKQSDYTEAKEEGVNIVEYRLTDDSLKASDLYMEENLNTGEITISGRGDDYQQVELTYTPGDRIVNVESGKTSEAAPSFNAEAQTKSAGQAEKRDGFLGNQDTTPDLMGRHPVVVSEKGTFEASEFQKGHEGWADVENFGGVDDLKGDLSSWEKIAGTSSKVSKKDIEAEIKRFLETQKKPVEPDMAKGGRVGFANGGFGYGGAGSEGDLSVSQISGFDPNTAEGAYSLMKGLPGLMDLYRQKSVGPKNKALRTIDPTFGHYAGGHATHNMAQWNELKDQWRQKMDDDILAAEEYYGFNPSEDQRKMLIENFGPMLKSDYSDKHSLWVSADMADQLKVDSHMAQTRLNNWLPGQTDLFDSIYGYNKGGRVGLQQGGNPDKTNKERADWIEKLIRMKQAKKFNAEQELPSGFWEQLRMLDPWDDTPDRRRAINETDMRYRDEIFKLRYDAAKEEADYQLRLMEQEQNAPIEVAQGGRIGFQEGGASGIGSILNQINQLNNTVAQNAFAQGSQMGAQNAAGQINSSQPTLSAAVGQISNQIGQLGQGIQQMIRPPQGPSQTSVSQPATTGYMPSQARPTFEFDMSQFVESPGTPGVEHFMNPTEESTQQYNEFQDWVSNSQNVSDQFNQAHNAYQTDLAAWEADQNVPLQQQTYNPFGSTAGRGQFTGLRGQAVPPNINGFPADATASTINPANRPRPEDYILQRGVNTAGTNSVSNYANGGLTRTVPPQRGPLANGIGTRFKERQVWL